MPRPPAAAAVAATQAPLRDRDQILLYLIKRLDQMDRHVADQIRRLAEILAAERGVALPLPAEAPTPDDDAELTSAEHALDALIGDLTTRVDHFGIRQEAVEEQLAQLTRQQARLRIAIDAYAVGVSRLVTVVEAGVAADEPPAVVPVAGGGDAI